MWMLSQISLLKSRSMLLVGLCFLQILAGLCFLQVYAPCRSMILVEDMGMDPLSTLFRLLAKFQWNQRSLFSGYNLKVILSCKRREAYDQRSPKHWNIFSAVTEGYKLEACTPWLRTTTIKAKSVGPVSFNPPATTALSLTFLPSSSTFERSPVIILGQTNWAS